MASEDITPSLLYSAAGVFLGLDIALVSLRCYLRRLQHNPLGPDDWTCAASLVFVIAMAITIIVETKNHRLGYPQTGNIDAPDTINAGIAWYPLSIIQVPALGLGRISILLYYRRVFGPGASKLFKRTIWGTVLACILWTIGFLFAWIFVCGRNPSAYWHSPVVRTQVCASVGSLINAYVATDFAFDLILIILPLPSIWRLTLSTSRKIGISLLFVLGASTIAASAVRLAVLVQSEVIEMSSKYANVNIELIDSAGMYWSMIEAGLVVCTACVPSLYSVYKLNGIQSVKRSSTHLSLQSLSEGRRTRDTQGWQKTDVGSSRQDSQAPLKKLTASPMAGNIEANIESRAEASRSRSRGKMPYGNGILVTQSLDRESMRIGT